MSSANARSLTVRLLSEAASAALLLAAGPALAQSTTAPPQPPPSNGSPVQAQGAEAQQNPSGIAEVVVTAERRSEAVSKVPISVQVVTAKAIDEQAVVDTRDLATFIPTVTFNSSAGAMLSSFGLRGVASVATSPGIQSSTALVVDGVPVYNQGEFIAGLGDISRVEVLNGPQGTLFGKNSTAGVINVVTQNPTNILAGSLEASGTSDGEVYLRGMINAPLADNVRFRANAFYQDLQPQIHNLTGKDGDGLITYGLNAKLAIDLSPKATFTLSGTYSHSDSSENTYLCIGPGILAGFATSLGVQLPCGRAVTSDNLNTPSTDFYKIGRAHV